jgi:hypothetical protein
MDDQLQDAQRELELALSLLPRGRSKNRTAILSYLVPVAMMQGRMPRSTLLKQNGLSYFLPLVEALKAGNPVAVEDALVQEEKRYMRVRTCSPSTRLFVRLLQKKALFDTVCLLFSGVLTLKRAGQVDL